MKVTVCLVSQFELVKVRLDGETVTSPVSVETIESTALDVGSDAKFAHIVEVDPVSETSSSSSSVPKRISSISNGTGVGVAVAPGIGVGVIVGVGVGVGAAAGTGVGVAPGTGVGVGTDVAVATGIAAPFSKVINAVIDHDVPRAEIVPVLPFSELIPPNITVDPVTVGNAVTVMVEP